MLCHVAAMLSVITYKTQIIALQDALHIVT